MLKNHRLHDVDQVADLGARLRQRRKELGLTLEWVANKAGVTTGFVSQVERNITSPSLVSLTSLTAALDSHITEFFSPPPRPAETSRADMREIYASPGGRFEFERLSTSFPGSTVNALVVHHPPGFVLDEMLHDGEEFYFILQGTLTVTLDGKTIELSEGDSIHFDSKRPHALRNDTSDTVTALVVNTMEIFGEDRNEESEDE